MSSSLNFEYWLRHTLPKELGLSKNKRAALDCVLCNFADYVRPLEAKAPKEFDSFFEELKKAISRASRKRTPKNYSNIAGHYEPIPKKKVVLLDADRKRRKEQRHTKRKNCKPGGGYK